jgi:hypothetical protein
MIDTNEEHLCVFPRALFSEFVLWPSDFGT